MMSGCDDFLRRSSAIGLPSKADMVLASVCEWLQFGRRPTLAHDLISRIIDFPDLGGAFIEIVEQACIDPHFTKIFPEGLPVSTATADWTVVNTNHSIAPDIGCRLA